MADLASLRIAVDSRSVESASTDLNTMSASAGRSSAAVDKLVASNNRLAAAVATSNKPIIDATRYINSMERELSQVGKSALQIKALEIRMAAAAAPTAELAREIRQVGASLIVAERNAQTTGGAMQQLTAVGGMQRQGFQQLGYQIGDISTMYALGARPTQIFASQIGQITQAVQLAAGGTSRFAAFLGGPWGIALTVAVMALGPLIGMLFQTDESSKDAESSIKDLAQQMDFASMSAADFERVNQLLADSNSQVAQTALQAAQAARQNANASRLAAQEKIKEAQANIALLESFILDPRFAEGASVYGAQIERLDGRIARLQTTLSDASGASRSATFSIVTMTAGMNAQERQAEALRQQINGLQETYEDTGSPVALARAVALTAQLGLLEQAERSSGDVTRVRAERMSDAERAAQQQTKSTQDFIESLNEETVRLGMNAAQLRQREVELQRNLAQTDAEREAIERANAAREEAFTNEARLQAQRESDKSIADSIKELNDLNAALFEEQMLRGLTGTERELTAIDLEQEALMASLTTEQMLALGHSYLAYFEAKRAAAIENGALAAEREEAERLTDQLHKMGSMLDTVFGTKGKIGGFLQELEVAFPQLFDIIKVGLDGILQGLGTSLEQLGKSVATGVAVANVTKKLGLPSSRTGGAVGGAIGGAAAERLGIPREVGEVAGALFWSTTIGLLKGVKKASATIEVLASNEVKTTVEGNEKLKKIASGMADSLINGLQDIADALGGELMAGMKISIGQRGGTFRVDPLGLGRTKGMEKFKTEEEAIAYAMKLAIEKGVIAGIRESTQRLLAAGNDLQAAIEKSVLFESVFDRLLEKTDPLAYSMQKLDEEFEKLKAVFDEAGASLEEYAALQQLYAIEQQQLVVDAAQAALEAQRRINDLMIRLYDASGDSAASLALAREMELAAATEAEKAILRQIYAIEDFTAARDKEVESLQETIDTMQAFSDSLKDFRDSLFKADAGVASYKTALLDLMRVGGLASTGDATALGQLQGVSETFLTASMARASSLFEYQKDVALVAGYVDQGIAAAGEQIDAAQQQIDILDAQLQELISLNSGLDTLNQTLGGGAQTTTTLPVFDANQTGSSVIAGASSDSNAQLASLMAEGLYTIAKNTGATYSLLDRWDGDGQPDIREYVNDYY